MDDDLIQKLQREAKKNYEKAHEYFDKKTENITQFVFIGFSDEVNRIRRNLLITNSVTLIYLLSGANIESFNLFGIVIKSVEKNFIFHILLVFLIYHSMHFIAHFHAHREQRKSKNKEISKTLDELGKIKNIKIQSSMFYSVDTCITRLNNHQKSEEYLFLNWCILELWFPLVLSAGVIFGIIFLGLEF